MHSPRKDTAYFPYEFYGSLSNIISPISKINVFWNKTIQYKAKFVVDYIPVDFLF